ncbi:hypothetical protein CKO24_13585 [Rhodothalassium salexigens DSM 2132]|nr:hypothetical protein [Rhodothalassium salexigens DSM 2132]
MLSIGFAAVGVAVMRLTRLYMGRSAPADLTDTTPPAALADALRHRTNPHIGEPQGAVDRLIAAVFHRLQFIPEPLRYAALIAGHSALRVLAIALVTGLVYLIASSNLLPLSATEWNWFAALVALGQLLALIGWARSLGQPTRTVRTGPGALALSVVLALLAPAAIVWVSQNPTLTIPALPIDGLPWLIGLTVLAIAAPALVFAAVLVRAASADPQTDVSECAGQRQVTRQPLDLVFRFDQSMLEFRLLEIPNRQYAAIDPHLQREGDGSRGSFTGLRLVETQPEPLLLREKPLLFGWILALTALATAVSIAALAVLFIGARELSPAAWPEAGQAVLGFVALWVTGLGLFRAATLLRAEMWFRSKLVLLELQGTFQETRMVVGKGVHDSTMSENQMIRAELTERIWCAELLSSSFVGVTAASFRRPRHMLRLEMDDATLDAINRSLHEYEQGTQNVAGLQSQTDVETVQQFQALNAEALSQRHRVTGPNAAGGAPPSSDVEAVTYNAPHATPQRDNQ